MTSKLTAEELPAVVPSPAWGEEEKMHHQIEQQSNLEDATLVYFETSKTKTEGCDIYEVHIFLEDEFRLENRVHTNLLRELFSYQNIYREDALYETRHLVEVRGKRQLVTYFSRLYPANRTAEVLKSFPGVFAYNVKKVAYDTSD